MSVKGQLTEANPLIFSEYLRLLHCLHEDKLFIWEAYCKIAFCTALRISDVRSTRWKDILWKKELIKEEKKTRKIRIIPLNEEVQVGILKVYQSLGSPDPELSVICNPRTKKPYSESHINRMLKLFKFRYKLSIRNISTHTLRKTFGHYVYDMWEGSSEALLLLNAIFKHTSIEDTKRYIGLTQDNVNRVYDSLKFSYSISEKNKSPVFLKKK